MSEKKKKVKVEKVEPKVIPVPENWVKPIGDVPVEEVKPEADKPKVEKTPEQKGAGAKAQWADETKRARLKFGMLRWSSCGKPAKKSEEYAKLLAETRAMLADGSWKTYVFPAPEAKAKTVKTKPKADEK